MNDDYYLDEEKEEEIGECFRMFDKDKDGYVTIKELELVFRSLGFDYNENSLNDLLKDYEDLPCDKNNNVLVKFSIFQSIVKKNMRDVDLEEELKLAFGNFTKTNEIPISEFKHLMKTLGDKLSDEEIEEMIRDSQANESGVIDCEKFIKLLTSK